MRRTIEIAGITLRQAMKERSFHVILVTTLFAMMGIPVLYSFTMFEVPRILSGFALSYTNFAVLVLMLFLTMNLSQTDLDRKTLQYVISLPITRKDYIIGRFFGFLFFSFLLTYIVLFLLAPLVFLVSRQRYDAPLYMGYFFLYGFFLNVEIAVLIAFALLFLSLTSKTIVSMFAVVATYLIGHTIDEVSEFLKTRMGESMPLFSKIVIQLTRYLFPNLALFDLKTNFIYGKEVNGIALILIALYGVFYSLLILYFAILLFERKEIY